LQKFVGGVRWNELSIICPNMKSEKNMAQREVPVMEPQVGYPQDQPLQQVPMYGGGGGGWGGGPRGGGPRGFDPKEVAQLFRQLADASGRLFTAETRFLLTEQSAHDLLTGSFEALAVAAEQGRLPDIIERMQKMSGEQRTIATQRMVLTAGDWSGLPLFTESEGRDVVQKIKDCLLPGAPE
jgi:hypothetical protein